VRADYFPEKWAMEIRDSEIRRRNQSGGSDAGELVHDFVLNFLRLSAGISKPVTFRWPGHGGPSIF
jgi:hypothetical protein